MNIQYILLIAIIIYLIISHKKNKTIEKFALSDTDKTIIDVEYQKILDNAYSVLEKELEEVEDENYIKLIERKIKIIDDRVQLFLED